MGGEGWAGGPWARGGRGGRKGSGLNPSSPTPRAPPVPPLPACPPERRDGKGDGVPKLLPSPPSLPPPPRPSPSLPLLPLTEPGRERRRVRTSYYEDGLLRGGGLAGWESPAQPQASPPARGDGVLLPSPPPSPPPSPSPSPSPSGGLRGAGTALSRRGIGCRPLRRRAPPAVRKIRLPIHALSISLSLSISPSLGRGSGPPPPPRRPHL